jgi:ribose-phosphate pyrophosphokinase
VNALVLALPDGAALGRRVSEEAAIPFGAVDTRRFPDGETYLRLDAPCTGCSVVLVCSLDHPDDKLLPLVFLAEAARAEGAVRVGLVAPYLAYMRQDRQFQSGEAVTSRTFAGLLSRHVDWLVTVDPHLHRYRALREIYGVPTRVVHAAPALAAWIAANVERPLVVGPDQESTQWVQEVAGLAGAPFVVMRKTRHGDRDVEIAAPDLEAWRGHTPVVVDDVVSSAQTMIQTVTHLVAAGLPAPVCVAVHALFSAGAEPALRAAGVARIVSTNTVPHATAGIDIVPLLIPAIQELAAVPAPDRR